MQAHIVSSSSTANGDVAELVVRAFNDASDGAAEVEILHRPEAVGTRENCAYLLFGIPAYATWSLMDLNYLPEDVVVCVTIQQGDRIISQNEFTGKNGNAPQAAPIEEGGPNE